LAARHVVFLMQISCSFALTFPSVLFNVAKTRMKKGTSAEDARSEAQPRFGNLAPQPERGRNWGLPLLESVFQDIRYGLRGMWQAPGFSIVAILTLALGIGATTAIFSITNTVLLRPLPYPDADRLVFVWTVAPRFPEFKLGQSKPEFDEIRSQARSFRTMAIYQSRSLTLTGSGDPEQIPAAAVSPDFLQVFSVQPILGRGFEAGDDELKNGNVVLLSEPLWVRRFGRDPKIVGRQVTLDYQSYTVAGILPQDFSFPRKVQAWVPLVLNAKDRVERAHWMYFALGRLNHGVSLAGAQAEMDKFAAQFSGAFPKDEAGIGFRVMPMRDWSVGQDDKSQLWLLAGAVSFLLLIGCSNVSNLILSRGVQRRREIALRAALGAGRARILRQLLVESLLLALAGGLAGLLLAVAGIRTFRGLAPVNFTRPGRDPVGTDGRPDCPGCFFACRPAVRAGAGVAHRALRFESGPQGTDGRRHRFATPPMVARVFCVLGGRSRAGVADRVSLDGSELRAFDEGRHRVPHRPLAHCPNRAGQRPLSL
jgi:putative ABC transport system permease protein